MYALTDQTGLENSHYDGSIDKQETVAFVSCGIRGAFWASTCSVLERNTHVVEHLENAKNKIEITPQAYPPAAASGWWDCPSLTVSPSEAMFFKDPSAPMAEYKQEGVCWPVSN